MVMTQEACQTLGEKYQQTGKAEDIIYNEFLYFLQTEPAYKVLEKFSLLLIKTEKYPNSRVQESIKTMSNSPTSREDCSSFFYRCCQLFIYYWAVKSETKSAIFDLLSLFKKQFSIDKNNTNSYRLWHEEINHFSKSSQYLKLQNFTRLINPRHASNASKPEYLGDLIGRYPFLYQYHLLDNNSSQEYINLLASIKIQQQQSFKKQLLSSITLHKSRLEVARIRQFTQTGFPPIQFIKNPTLLKEEQFQKALQTFSKLNKNKTDQNNKINCLQFSEFKIWLMNYLSKDIEQLSRRIQFEQYFNRTTFMLFSDCNEQPTNNFLILRTCNQLLNEWVVDPSQTSTHISFAKLKNFLGATEITVLLLKLISLAPQLKYSLRQKLANLFEYYESTPIEQSFWFIQILENCLVAFAIYGEKKLRV
jgi:hypothetical protein